MPRTLSEQEFEALKARVLASAPALKDEADFDRWVGPAMEQALGEAENLPAQPEGSGVRRLVSGAAEMLNPIAVVKGLYGAVRHPIETGTAVMGAMGDQWSQANQARREGRVSEMVGHAAAGVLPVVGPVAAQVGQQIGAGDWAGGAGAAAGLLAPAGVGPLVRGARRAIPIGTRTAAATRLDAGAAARYADVMAPKVGANKARFGGMADKVAPSLSKDREMGALSREGLHAKVTDRLAQAEAALDAANDSRLSARTFPTQPMIDELLKKRKEFTAQTVEGSRPIPSVVGGVARGTAVNPMRTYSLRWMEDEMQSFPFVKRTWNDLSGEVGLRGNAAGGHAEIVPGAAGARIYREIVGPDGSETIRATRAQVTEAIQDVMNGKVGGTLRQRVLEVADELAEGGPAQRSMETPGPAVTARDMETTRWNDIKGTKQAPPLYRKGRPLGEDVDLSPNEPRVAMIDRAITELKQLGPVTRYDEIRKIRQAYDQPAKAVYSPAMTTDYMKAQGGKLGAADVTGTLREQLAAWDPQTAVANVEYSLYRKADDVLQATAEVERTRPRVGRHIMTRLTTTLSGGQLAGPVGAGVGFIIAPFLEGAMSSGLTIKLQSAQIMTKLARAIRAGDVDQVTSLSTQMKRLLPSGSVLTGRTIEQMAPMGAEAQPAQPGAIGQR